MFKPQLILKALQDGVSPEWREAAVRPVLSLMTVLLLIASWQLWIPQQRFPQVPLFDWAGKLPVLLQWAILAECFFCLILGASFELRATVHRSTRTCWSLILLSCGMILLFCMDQHRLQPWAYQAVLMFLVLACVQARRALTLLRLLTLSIYFYSALSKLDYTFLHSMGQQFTETLFNLVGLSHWQWPKASRILLALLFPIGELLVVVLLAVPRTRKLGVYAALFMHGLLLLVLGPLGMNQQAAVLIWNVQFMLLAVLLFYGGNKSEVSKEREKSSLDLAEEAEEALSESPVSKQKYRFNPPDWLSFPAQGLILFALLAPLLKPLGYWDHWLAWDLYSPGTSKAQVFLHTSDVEHLPKAWQKYTQENKGDLNWVQIRLDLWSLDMLAAPIYPQARFQLGVAAAVSEKLPPDHDAWIILSGPANRFTGERKQVTIKTRPQLEAALNQYWLNARPVAE